MSHKEFSVELIGFDGEDVAALLRALKLSQRRARRYCAASPSRPPDLRLVSATAFPQVRDALMPTIVVSGPGGLANDESPTTEAYSLEPPLIATRVLRLLDKVTMDCFTDAPELAVGADQATHSRSILEAAARLIPRRFTQLSALVVDDSGIVRRQMEILLTAAGVAGAFAKDGQEALQLAARARYDVVFLDVNMPGLDGFQVCRTLRRGVPPPRVVMLTGKGSTLSRARGILAGASAYLTKPVSPDTLERTLEDVLKHRAAKPPATKPAQRRALP